MTDISRRGLLYGGLAVSSAMLVPSMVRADDRPKPTDPNFAEWVMDHIDDMHRGKSSHSVLEMTVQTEHWTRTLEMESWSRGEDYSLVRILSPKKERGTATL